MTGEVAAVGVADRFIRAAELAGLVIPRAEVEVQYFPSPHQPPRSLPSGKQGVYVFIYGDRCLKVGKAGPNSVARFCNHHYGLNAPSTLAKSVLKFQADIGVSGLTSANVKEWICQNTSRANFLLPTGLGQFALTLLEAFVQCALQPEFEGFASQRKAP